MPNHIRCLDGRVCFSITDNSNQEQVEIKYQLLNPSTPFRDIVDTARSVILAGGTMSPVCPYIDICISDNSDPSQMSDIVSQLFSYLPQDRLSNFSCGHIIPPSNLQTLLVGKGPRGGDLEFTFDRRGNKPIVSQACGVEPASNSEAHTQIAELGQILSNFINVVPGGMVVFFPSYGFLNAVKTEWTACGTMEKFSAKKKVELVSHYANKLV